MGAYDSQGWLWLHAWVCPKGRLMAASHYKAYLLKSLSFCFNRGSILDWTGISEKGKTED